MLRACYRHAANALTVHPRVQMLILTSALLQTGETNLVEKKMEQMEQERLAILEHPVVRSISDVILDRSKGGRPGFRVSLCAKLLDRMGMVNVIVVD